MLTSMQLSSSTATLKRGLQSQAQRPGLARRGQGAPRVDEAERPELVLRDAGAPFVSPPLIGF